MIHSIRNLDTDFTIEFELGNVCNFKCNYCFPGSNEGNCLWPDIEKVDKALLNYIKKHNRKTRLYLIGGEPTLWKHLPRFCNNIKSAHDVTINISTNASKSMRWWKKYWTSFDVVNISVHHEFSNVEHAIKVADFLYEKNIEVNIDVLMDPGNFNECKQIVEQCKQSKNLFPIIAKTVIFNGSHIYSTAQLQYMEKFIKRYPDLKWYNKVMKRPHTQYMIDDQLQNNNSYLINNNLNHFKGWKCNLGVDLVKINSAGDIKGNCGQNLNLNIYNLKGFEIKPVVCEQNTCPCAGETIVTKWKCNDYF